MDARKMIYAKLYRRDLVNPLEFQLLDKLPVTSNLTAAHELATFAAVRKGAVAYKLYDGYACEESQAVSLMHEIVK